jgi:hypothetical protein
MQRKTQGGPSALQEPLVCKHLESKMQSLTRTDMVVNWELLSYGNNGRKRDLDETNTFIVNFFFKLLGLPPVHLPLPHIS